jgi:hypothetical protein
MKVCPRCSSKFSDDLNFCLNDGILLTDISKFDEDKTLAFSDEPTIEGKSPDTADQNKQTLPIIYPLPKQKRGLHPLSIIVGVVGILLLVFGTLFGAVMYLRNIVPNFPTPTPRTTYSPSKSPTPVKSPPSVEKPELKIESIGKVKGSFNHQYLKYMLTNTSDKIVLNPVISVTFYQGDVKLKDLSGESKLKYLKPGQTVPVWVDLFFGSDKFTEAKTSTSDRTTFATKPESELYPELTLTDTKMVVTRGNSMYNNYSYSENWYTVSGVVENTNYDTISPKVYVILYDENSNIIGIEETGISNLKRGEKQKFETGAGEISSLFGKAKKFEIIVTDQSN